MLFWIIFGITHLCSFLFYFVVLQRVHVYTQQFLLHETVHVKLFKCISIRHVFILYFFGLIVMALLELLYIFAIG